MEDELERLGVHVDAWYFCPHHPDYSGQCDRRKPTPGMMLAAMRNFDANAVDCVMYDDMPTDEAAARTADIILFTFNAAFMTTQKFTIASLNFRR